jgi:pullulanase
MVDSVKFWAEEYNLSGFRFDLMKLHDVDTMNAITDTLHAIDPTILVYGEPWTGGTSPLPESESAYNGTLDQMPGVAVFNDDTRDGIKGSVFNADEKGFIQGVSSGAYDERIKLGVVGATGHSQLAVASLPKGSWAVNPNQTINYATAHDNNVLYDKIMLSTSDLTNEQIKDMQKQAGGILLTSNGVPFLHGGIELMRTKPCTYIAGEAQGECDNGPYDHNSYRSPDQTNQIDWQWKVDNLDVFNYYKGLIEIRRSVDVFSYDSLQDLNQHLFFLPDSTGMVSYIVYDETSPWEYTLVAYNNAVVERPLDLQGYTWNMVVDKDTAGLETISVEEGTYTMRPNETVVMYIQNANVVFVPGIIEDAIADLDGAEFNNKNIFDKEALIQAIKAQVHDDAIIEITEDIDYDEPGDYNVTVKVTDQFGSVTTDIFTVTILDPEGLSGLVIGGIIAGVAAILGAVVLFIFKR